MRSFAGVSTEPGISNPPSTVAVRLITLALCLQLTQGLLGFPEGDSLGHRGRQTLPHYLPPSTVSR